MTKRSDLHLVKKELEDIQVEGLEDRFGPNYEQLHSQLLGLWRDEERISNFLKVQNIEGEEFTFFKTELSSVLGEKFMFTKYENPISYSILNQLFTKIVDSAKELDMETKDIPFIGTSLSRCYNAFACPVEGTEQTLIVFESEIFTLANMLAKVVSQCLPEFEITKEGVRFSLEKEHIREHISGNELIQKRFADLAFNGMYLGQPILTEQYFVEEHLAKLSYTFTESLELFVVGHEYGHIFAGHLEKKDSVSKITIGQNEFEAIKTNWKEEFQADELGLYLLLQTVKNDFPPFSFLGPELFFTFLDLEDRLFNFFKHGKASRSDILNWDSHPPHVDRRERIRMLMLKSIHINHHETYNALSMFLENVLEVLWENFEPRAKELRERIP